MWYLTNFKTKNSVYHIHCYDVKHKKEFNFILPDVYKYKLFKTNYLLTIQPPVKDICKYPIETKIFVFVRK